jgi:mitochondrial chaperone BCS1
MLVVHIFLANANHKWQWSSARHKRPLNSIVLEPGVKVRCGHLLELASHAEILQDMLMTDAREFLASEQWYAERGSRCRRTWVRHLHNFAIL